MAFLITSGARPDHRRVLVGEVFAGHPDQRAVAVAVPHHRHRDQQTAPHRAQGLSARAAAGALHLHGPGDVVFGVPPGRLRLRRRASQAARVHRHAQGRLLFVQLHRRIRESRTLFRVRNLLPHPPEDRPRGLGDEAHDEPRRRRALDRELDPRRSARCENRLRPRLRHHGLQLSFHIPAGGGQNQRLACEGAPTRSSTGPCQ